MFGVPSIRTRYDYKDAASAGQPGLPPRPSSEAGAESALQRTRSLLDAAIKQEAYINSNFGLATDVKVDEQAALSLVRSLMEELENCISENENPPPAMGRRKALIKVEKARRCVLAAVRECAAHVTESQRLFEEIERFIELRPDEQVSPRHFNIRWSRRAAAAPSRNVVARRRDQLQGRNMRVANSLVMSIAGLSAIAEGRELETPTADDAGGVLRPGPAPQMRPTAVAAQPAASAVTLRATKDPAAVRRGLDGGGEPSRPRAVLADNTNAVGGGGGPAGAAAAILAEKPLAGVVVPSSAGAAADSLDAAAQKTIQEARLLLQRMQLQPQGLAPAAARTTDSTDVQPDDDLRPCLSVDAVPSSCATTTMCNMDSCVSGPPQRPRATAAAATAGAGGEAADSNLHSGGVGIGYEHEEGDEEEDEDEVNSAESRRYDADSPDHRVVSLLGCAHTAAAAAAAVAATRSTAGSGSVATPPPHLGRQQSASASDPADQSLMQVAQRRSSGSVASEAAAGTAPSSATAAAAAEGAARGGFEPGSAVTHSRAQPGSEPRRRASATSVPIAGGTAAVQPLPRAVVGSAGGAAAGGVFSEILVAEGPRADAAAAELDDIGLLAAVTQQQPAAAAQAPRYGVTRRHAAAAALPPQYPSAAAAHHLHAGAVPPLPDCGVLAPYPPAAAVAYPYPSLPPQYAQQYPATAVNPHTGTAAAAAAAPNLGPHSLPPSVPSSLRDFPVGAPVNPHGLPPRSGTLGGAGAGAVSAAAAALLGPRYGASQPASGHQSMDSGQFPASASGTAWDNVSLADTEPLPGGTGRRGRRGGRRRGGGLMGLVRNVVGFVGVSVLSGAAVVLGAAAVNTGLDDQVASSQQAQQRQGGGRRGHQRLGRGGDDLIPQRTLQQLRSPDLLALGRG